ncbi:putative uncharacterized protein [Bacteroides sp. CAG:875]|nr:putative uncharacterized protein [Bacteroides sp. CAG:875]
MDVLQILIFLGFICLGFYQTMRKKQPKSARRKVVRKFVPADFFPMEEAIPEEVRMAPPPEARKKKKKHSVKQEKQPEKEQKQVPLQTEKPEEDRSEYAFRTPSDARRAFIYSEIFRRKYD